MGSQLEGIMEVQLCIGNEACALNKWNPWFLAAKVTRLGTV